MADWGVVKTAGLDIVNMADRRRLAKIAEMVVASMKRERIDAKIAAPVSVNTVFGSITVEIAE